MNLKIKENRDFRIVVSSFIFCRFYVIYEKKKKMKKTMTLDSKLYDVLCKKKTYNYLRRFVIDVFGRLSAIALISLNQNHKFQIQIGIQLVLIGSSFNNSTFDTQNLISCFI
jgi:hypothetical protein